jgi:hypothetical protein
MFAPRVAKLRPRPPEPVISIDRLSTEPPPTEPRSIRRWPFGLNPAASQAIRDATGETPGAVAPSPASLADALDEVRLRTDPAADHSARLLGAAAVTIGDQILFRGDRQPGSPTGDLVLAHELIHVIHQAGSGHPVPQRLVVADVLSVQYTRAMAEQMTDAELEQQVDLLRAHLMGQPGDRGAAQNLAVLEEVAHDRLPGRPATPVASAPPVEQHGWFWWRLHALGLTETKHERAELLRRAWGSRSGVVVLKDGEEVDVDLLSDDEVIELNRRLRGRPIGPPLVTTAGPVLTAARGGNIVGWGTSNSPEAVRQTEAVTRSLTTERVQQMQASGLTRTWVVENLAKYERAAAAGGDKLRNAQLLPRLALMRRLLELLPPP